MIREVWKTDLEERLDEENPSLLTQLHKAGELEEFLDHQVNAAKETLDSWTLALGGDENAKMMAAEHARETLFDYPGRPQKIPDLMSLESMYG